MKRKYSIDAPDQARLKTARLEIEAILKRHDLGGVVVLHTPGMSEFFYDIAPTYSCIWIENESRLRVRSKLEAYNGDREAQLHDQAATANMTRSFADNMFHGERMFHEIDKMVSKATNAEHIDLGFAADPMEARKQ